MMDNKFARIINEYHKYTGTDNMPSQFYGHMMNGWSKDYDTDLIIDVMKVAHQKLGVTRPSTFANYTNGFLLNLARKGIVTAKQFEDKRKEMAKYRLPTTDNHTNPSMTSIHNAVMARYGKKSNPLTIDISHQKPTKAVMQLAKQSVDKMGFDDVKPLAQMFTEALSLHYSKKQIVCAIYQYDYARNIKDKPITAPVKYYFGILRNSPDYVCDSIIKQISDLRQRPSVKRKKLLENPYARNYDGLVYLDSWANGAIHGYEANQQQKTTTAQIALAIGSVMKWRNTDYPTKLELKSAIIVTHMYLDSVQRHPDSKTPFLTLTHDDNCKAIQEAVDDFNHHQFIVIVDDRPLQTRTEKHVDLGGLTQPVIDGAINYCSQIKSKEKDSKLLQSFDGAVEYCAKYSGDTPEEARFDLKNNLNQGFNLLQSVRFVLND